MLKVKNKKTIKNLARKSFKANRSRNIIGVMAVALTAILFTTLFTLGIGTIDALQQATMRQAGGDGHAVVKYIDDEIYNNIKDHPLINEIAYDRILCDDVENDCFLKRRAEFWYYDDIGLKLGFVDLAGGHKPQAENEVIADTTTLELLGVPQKVGAPLTLNLNIRGQSVARDFVLAGWWQSDPAFNVGQIFSSRDYVDAHRDELVNTYYQDRYLTGAICSYIMFKNSFNLEDKLDRVITESGYSLNEEDPNYVASNVNWAYVSASMGADPTTLAALIGGLVLIILTGYLIIYNIFQISVTKDIRFYGLLKTIGTTKKQIAGIIRHQALLLSIIGIPIGLIAGFFIGKAMVPLMVNSSSYAGTQFSVSPSPWIFVFSTIFALITVFISTLKPGRMAGAVSPVEATKYTEGGNIKAKKLKKTANGAKLHRMALANLGRNKKRTVLVILSLCLSLVLLNTVFTISRSFDMDKYISKFTDTDFLVAHADYFNYSFTGVENQTDENLITAIEQQQEFKEGGRFYGGMEAGFAVADPKNTTQDYNMNGEGDFACEVYGAEDFPLMDLDLIDGELDYDKLMTGDYILEGVWLDDYSEVDMSTKNFEVGDKVTLGRYSRDSEGNPLTYETREFTVLGHVAIKYYTNCDGVGWDYNFYLPAEIYKTMVEQPAVMSYVFDVKDGTEEEMEAFLKDQTENVSITMNYSSKATAVDSFAEIENTLMMVGGAITAIIGLIGILNFLNAILTGIITRRREFAMLQSIGLTRKQLNKLLIFEGLYYTVGTGIFALIFGVIFSLIVVKPLVSAFWFTSFQFTLWPIILVLPVLLLLGIVIPALCCTTIQRHTIVEQLRDTE